MIRLVSDNLLLVMQWMRDHIHNPVAANASPPIRRRTTISAPPGELLDCANNDHMFIVLPPQPLTGERILRNVGLQSGTTGLGVV